MKKFLLISLLTLPLIADEAQPLSKSFASLGVGYGPHITPWGEYGRKVMIGVYDVTEASVVSIKGGKLETAVTNGPCYMHTLGEYVIVGGCGQAGAAATANTYGFAKGAEALIEYRFGKSQHWGAKVRVGMMDTTASGVDFGVKAAASFHWGN